MFRWQSCIAPGRRRALLVGLGIGVPIVALGGTLAGCGPNYSPNTYSANAVQQANKVEQGVIVGVRAVDISAPGTVGTVAGAAAGGIAGSQATGGVAAALTALGGGVVGGLLGSEVEHKVADTNGFEYIVRKGNGELVSVTQKDEAALTIGTHVLVIAGPQARIVPDYTVPMEPPKPASGVKPESSSPSPAASSTPPASTPPAAPAGTTAAATPPPTEAPVSVAPLPVPSPPAAAAAPPEPNAPSDAAPAAPPSADVSNDTKPLALTPLETKPAEPPAAAKPADDAPAAAPAPAQDKESE